MTNIPQNMEKEKQYCPLCKRLQAQSGKIYIAGSTCPGHPQHDVDIFDKGYEVGEKTMLEKTIEMVDKASRWWGICNDSKCPNKENCEIANHYVETVWKPTFDALKKSLQALTSN